MSSKIQTGKVQAGKIEQDNQTRCRSHPGVAEENRDQAGLGQLSDNLLGAASAGSIEGEAALLGDTRFLGAQRQVLAVRIGRRSGNLHLHSIIAQMQRNRSGESGSAAVIQRVPFNPADDQRVLQGGVIGGRAIEPCDIDLLILRKVQEAFDQTEADATNTSLLADMEMTV